MNEAVKGISFNECQIRDPEQIVVYLHVLSLQMAYVIRQIRSETDIAEEILMILRHSPQPVRFVVVEECVVVHLAVCASDIGAVTPVRSAVDVEAVLERIAHFYIVTGYVPGDGSAGGGYGVPVEIEKIVFDHGSGISAVAHTVPESVRLIVMNVAVVHIYVPAPG